MVPPTGVEVVGAALKHTQLSSALISSQHLTYAAHSVAVLPFCPQVGPSPNAKAMTLPARCPAVARKLFVACTQMDPERRPGAQQLVEWLRADIAAGRG